MKNKTLLWILGLLILVVSSVAVSALTNPFSNLSGGISILKIVVNSIIIAAALYIALILFLSDSFEKKSKFTKGLFIGVVLILGVTLAFRIGNLWIWENEAFVKPLFKYLFSGEEGNLGILRPTRILIFMGASFLLYWLFTTKVKIGGDQKKVDLVVAVLLAADMTHEGLTSGWLVAAGQIISTWLLYDQFKGEGEKKFNWSACIWAIGLVTYISAIVFPGKGFALFTWGAALMGLFGWWGSLLGIIILAVFAKWIHNKKKDADDAADAKHGTGRHVGQHLLQKLIDFTRTTHIPLLSEFLRDNEVRDVVLGDPDRIEFGTTLRKIWYELFVHMNYMLRLEVYDAKSDFVKGTKKTVGKIYAEGVNKGKDKKVHVHTRSGLHAQIDRFKIGTGYIYDPEVDPDTEIRPPDSELVKVDIDKIDKITGEPIRGGKETILIHPKVISRIGIENAKTIGPRTGEWIRSTEYIDDKGKKSQLGLRKDFWNIGNDGKLNKGNEFAFDNEVGAFSTYYMLMAFFKGVKEGIEDLTGRTIHPSQLDTQIGKVAKRSIHKRVETERDDVNASYGDFTGYLNRMSSSNNILNHWNYIHCALLLHGEYRHEYRFARIGSKIYKARYRATSMDDGSVFYNVDPIDDFKGRVESSNPNEDPDKGLIKMNGTEEVKVEGKLEDFEVTQEGYFIEDLNKIKFYGGNYNGRAIELRRVKVKAEMVQTEKINGSPQVRIDKDRRERRILVDNIICYPRATDSLKGISEDWEFFFRDFRDGSFHPKSKKSAQYEFKHKGDRMYNYKNLPIDNTIPGRGSPAFDREAYKDTGRFIYWGKEKVGSEEDDLRAADPSNPWPALTSIGATNYLGSFINTFASEEVRKQMEKFVYETGSDAAKKDKLFAGRPETGSE
ncbi:MAG: hypothetical protein U9O94_10210 [Nanoarchaeota archaeon]|nr:hypothetical protein [Nanoarchaeota archaeon]